MFQLPDSWVWDFWIVKNQDNYHLFFLYASRALHDPERRHHRAGIGHAVSTDLTRWERVTDALVHDDPPSFDHTATWTGSIVQGEDQRWYLFYTGATLTEHGQLRQQIGLATSDDLFHWRKHDSNPLVRADPRWYETLGGPHPWHDEHWRDPWVFKDPGGYGWHMLITARANTGPVDDRGVLGHARSTDLINWTVNPPLTAPGAGFGHLEVPQVEIIDNQPVLIFNCPTHQLAADRTARGEQGGIWAASARSLLGPYDITGATRVTDETLYVGRPIQDPHQNWQFMAFNNTDNDGAFVGSLIDPLPLSWDGETLRIKRALSTTAALD